MIKKIVIHNHEPAGGSAVGCGACNAGYVPTTGNIHPANTLSYAPTTQELLQEQLDALEAEARDVLGEALTAAREAHEELTVVLNAAAAAFGTHDFAAWRRVRDRAFDAAEATEAAVVAADAAVQAARMRAHALRTAAHDDVRARLGALRETMEERLSALNQAIKAEHEAQERLERATEAVEAASQAEADARNEYRDFEFRNGHL